MNTINPLSFREEINPNITDKGAFPYRTVTDTGRAAEAQPLAGVDRMKQLEKMLQEAQGRAEVIEKEAYDNAYLAGEKAGMALGQKRAEQLLESIQETLQGAEKSIDEVKLAFAETALDVAQHIAEKIIAETLDTDRSKLWQIAEQAAEHLPDTSGLRIAVAPADHAIFKRLLDESELMAILTSDDAIQPATCRIISIQEDILIDPVAAVANYMDQLRPELLTETVVTPESNDGPQA
ncbi:flagellar assembly protein [Mariprofundus sp. NF]|uniref:FliH/SctL family protein n=1 Tax=Mariprofundus sp. NF TaxID=2608716 RepID=UPI00159FCF3D|nr:FliH/SctL family protein [Mariprofundus sp. NF]NWF37683.1 flagellar assembly protein [Mariprofundus sp. NF]